MVAEKSTDEHKPRKHHVDWNVAEICRSLVKEIKFMYEKCSYMYTSKSYCSHF